MPRHLISDAHEWINEIPTVPIYYLAKPQPRERAWQNQRGKKTLLSLTLVWIVKCLERCRISGRATDLEIPLLSTIFYSFNCAETWCKKPCVSGFKPNIHVRCGLGRGNSAKAGGPLSR